MPSYRNDTSGVVQMLGINVPAGDIVETGYYPQNDSIVLRGATGDEVTVDKKSVIVQTFTEAISAGDITKTSDQPTYLIIDTSLGSSGANTDWVYLKAQTLQYDVSVDMDTGSFSGTIQLQKKYYDSDDAKLVNEFTSSDEIGLSVETDAFYRFEVTSHTSGTAYVKLG